MDLMRQIAESFKVKESPHVVGIQVYQGRGIVKDTVFLSPILPVPSTTLGRPGLTSAVSVPIMISTANDARITVSGREEDITYRRLHLIGITGKLDHPIMILGTPVSSESKAHMALQV